MVEEWMIVEGWGEKNLQIQKSINVWIRTSWGKSSVNANAYAYAYPKVRHSLKSEHTVLWNQKVKPASTVCNINETQPSMNRYFWLLMFGFWSFFLNFQTPTIYLHNNNNTRTSRWWLELLPIRCYGASTIWCSLYLAFEWRWNGPDLHLVSNKVFYTAMWWRWKQWKIAIFFRRLCFLLLSFGWIFRSVNSEGSHSHVFSSVQMLNARGCTRSRISQVLHGIMSWQRGGFFLFLSWTGSLDSNQDIGYSFSLLPHWLQYRAQEIGFTFTPFCLLVVSYSLRALWIRISKSIPPQHYN